MSEPSGQIVNPMLALTALYKKDKRNFDDVINDVAKHLNAFGMNLDNKYIKDKVLPFVYSLLFMTTCQEILQQYIQGLAKPNTRNDRPGAKPPARTPGGY